MEEAGSDSKKKTPRKDSTKVSTARSKSSKSEDDSGTEKKTSAKKAASGTAKPSAKKSAEAAGVETQPEPIAGSTVETEPEEPKQSKAAAAAAAATPPAAQPAKEESQPAQEAEPQSPKDADVTDNTLLPATRGKAGLFGGPKDRSIKPDDKLALPIGRHFTYERARSLNWKSFYCAMRWNYRLAHMSPEEGKRWWANKKLIVTNPANGSSVVVRAVDYGPHENSGLDILISPGAFEAIGVEAGGEVDIAFADQKAPLGPVVS